MKIENIRCYSWCLILYENILDIISAIEKNILIISHYAISPLHDKDILSDGSLKESHYHLLITFKKNVSIPTIKSLFSFESNIFGEKCTNRYSAFNYLSHKYEKDKPIYDEKLIISNDIKYYIDTPTKEKQIEKNNETLELIDSLIAGYNYRELVQLYGKDFVINYKSYVRMARLICLQENNNDLGSILSDLNYVEGM